MGWGGDEFIPLAVAFLHGQVTVGPRSWIELVPMGDGTWVVPFPPAPALTYMPLMAFLGPVADWNEPSITIMPSLMGGLSVGLAFLILEQRLKLNRTAAIWVTAAFALSTFLWVAGMGGTHHYAQVCATAFSLAALYLALNQRLPLLAGLLFGLAVASRLPVGFTLPLFLYLYRREWWWFLIGAAPVAAGVAWYNWIRFDSPFDFGYARIPSGEHGLVTDEPWYVHGLMSPLYIPNGLYAMLLSIPNVDLARPPFIHPTIYATSLLITAPWLASAFGARGRLAAVAGISAGLVILVDLMHGNPGFSQFGYRFILDGTAPLLILVGLAVRPNLTVFFKIAAVIGAVVGVYGIVYFNLLN
jgi:hypothetical protein